MKIYIIGMHDQSPQFSETACERIACTRKFAGGKRHHQLVKHLLPTNAEWINISIPIEEFITEVRHSNAHWVVFASGDPLFFGIANTINRELPDAHVEVEPTMNSLQLLGHRLQKNYGAYHMVTLTGRPWTAFDCALVGGSKMISLLTDRKKTPAAIAQRLLSSGYTNVQIHVGECLGGADEAIHSLNVQEVAQREFRNPNCMFLDIENAPIYCAIAESDFETLPGRPRMITKMPIRIATLAAMKLHQKSVFWDVGACSGSVSIDAKLHYPHLDVRSFEIRSECDGIIRRNAQQFHAPGIDPVIGDFLNVDTSNTPQPDAVFVGGYGGKMHLLLDKIDAVLQKHGLLAFNSVREKSANEFRDWITNNNYKLIHESRISVDQHNPITIFVAEHG